MINENASKCDQKRYKMRPPKMYQKMMPKSSKKPPNMTPKMMKNVSTFALEDPLGPQEAP